MKTLREYMAMPYRMEIVEDGEEGGFGRFHIHFAFIERKPALAQLDVLFQRVANAIVQRPFLDGFLCERCRRKCEGQCGDGIYDSLFHPVCCFVRISRCKCSLDYRSAQ